ncbi:hypothetical protein IAT38_004971 [Cryptococcus sp. DSM 104549]
MSEAPPCPILVAEDESLYIPIPGHPELRLTPLSENDVDDIIALFNHPQVGKWAVRRPYPYTHDDTGFMLAQVPTAKAYLSRISASLPSPPPDTEMELFPLGVLREVKTGRMVGNAYAGVSVRDTEGGGLEIAYDLQPELWGQGLGKAMILALVAFARWSGVKRLIAFCEPENAASAGVLRKCGFSKYAEKDIEWPEEKGGGFRVFHGYEILL